VPSAPKGHQLTGLGSKLTGSQRRSLRHVLPGVALIAVGVLGLASLATRSPTPAMLGTLLLFGGAIEAAGGFANLRRKDAFVHVLVGVLSIEAGFIFLWLTADALIPLGVVITSLLALGGVFRFYLWMLQLPDGHASAPVSGIIDLILAVLILVEWPTSVFWVLALAVGISLVFRGVHWLNLGGVSRHRIDGANEPSIEMPAADHSDLLGRA